MGETSVAVCEMATCIAFNVIEENAKITTAIAKYGENIAP